MEKVFEELDRDEEFEVLTVSGWVMDELEKVPSEGDTFRYRDMQVTVLQMDGKRVGKVQICLGQYQEEKEGDSKEAKSMG